MHELLRSYNQYSCTEMLSCTVLRRHDLSTLEELPTEGHPDAKPDPSLSTKLDHQVNIHQDTQSGQKWQKGNLGMIEW